MSKEPKKASGLTLRHKIGYAMGDLGGCMTFALMTGIFTRYCLNILKVDNRLLAILLLVWNVWDAVNDPMMGAIMDRIYSTHHNPKGKFRPWLLRSAPMLCITAIALWSVPTFLEGIPMIAALFICKVAYEACYTMFNIPMGSLLAAMASDDGERAALSSARGFGSMIGNIIPMVVFPILLEAFHDTAAGYSTGAAVCAVLGLIACLLHYFWTEERNVTDQPQSSEEQKVKFADIIGVFAKNRPFLALCIHGICICTMQNVASSLGTYMYGDVLGNLALMSASSGIVMVLSLVTLAVAPVVAKKLGLENMIRRGLLISCVMFVALFVLSVVTGLNPWLYMVWSGLASCFASVSIYMQWGMVAEVIDYNEMVTGKRTEGSIYGTFNLSRRIGNTIGSSAAVLLLGIVGYSSDAAVQTAGAITGIKFLCILLPGIFCLGSWCAFKFVWNITPDIRARLAKFKAAHTASGETPAGKN